MVKYCTFNGVHFIKCTCNSIPSSAINSTFCSVVVDIVGKVKIKLFIIVKGGVILHSTIFTGVLNIYMDKGG